MDEKFLRQKLEFVVATKGDEIAPEYPLCRKKRPEP